MHKNAWVISIQFHNGSNKLLLNAETDFCVLQITCLLLGPTRVEDTNVNLYIGGKG